MHYLVGMTAATKDLPQWLWFAIEHVGNPGRCDYTGCNDSFGYRDAEAPSGTWTNFIAPHAIPDNLDQGRQLPLSGVSPVGRRPGVSQSRIRHPLNLFGYPQSTKAAPDLDWFYVTGSNTYRALQSEFHLGCCVATSALTPDQIAKELK